MKTDSEKEVVLYLMLKQHWLQTRNSRWNYWRVNHTKIVEESDAPTVIAIRNKVLNTTVKGVPEIERVTLVQKDDEWVIQTTGSNIAKVLEVKGIDKRNVRTNNVFEIAGTLGIEAARNALINELNSTLEDQGLRG